METLDAYLDELASERPTPGGGSAAALTGALGAALVAMVARLTAANPKFAARAGLATELAAEADGLRALLLRERSADESAFAAVVAAQALPRATDEEKRERTETLQRSLEVAARAPLDSARTALEVLLASERACALGNANLSSDAGCAAELASAAIAAAAYNVRANHPYMKDAALVEAQRGELLHLERERERLLAGIRATLGAAR